MTHIGTPLDLTVRGLYECVSGPAGAPREWDRLRELYTPNARIQVLHRLETGGAAIELLTFEQYRQTREPYFKRNPFFESEVDRDVSIRGNLAHVFSEFEVRREPGGVVIMTGYTSIQMVLSDELWRVLSILWEAHAETPKLMSPGVIPVVDGLTRIVR